MDGDDRPIEEVAGSSATQAADASARPSATKGADASAPVAATDPPSRRRRRWRAVALGCAAVVALAAVWFAINLFQVWQTGRSDQARPVDAIVVMGAAQYDGRPSPQLSARLDHVVELYRAGWAPLVITTGGKLPLDRFTEAGASAKYLTARGVPASAIVQEDQGRTSWESMQGVARLMHERSLKRALLVSDPYHSLRIRLMGEDLGLDSFVSPTRTSPVSGWSAARREVQEAAGISVGRIIGWDRFARWFD
jgi:uncharacterized SAM-binding protein YcdF (DUF218 family)